ncbi:MAG: hypothetical protein DSY46_05935, partial [Hydrogenimonas sp.]
MDIINHLNRLLNHPLVNTIIQLIQKLKSSKNYWTVVTPIIIFTIREAVAWKLGEVIEAFAQKQIEHNVLHPMLWEGIALIFGGGGSWELVILGTALFLVLSFVKVSESANHSMTVKENILTIMLLIIVTSLSLYQVNGQHTNSKEIVTIAQDTRNIRQDTQEIKKLIQGLQIYGNKEKFLKEYFGEDWKKALQNPKTYKNLKIQLAKYQNNAQKLLEEKRELLRKIASQRLDDTTQKEVEKAFNELRFDDVRKILDRFIAENQATGDDLVKAHYQKALSYMEEVRYNEAKEEFEKYIPIGIEDADILNDYGGIYYKLGDYDKALEHLNRALQIRLATLGKNHPDTAVSYNNIGLVWDSKGEYNKALEFDNQALQIYLATLGKNHPSTASSYNNIGAVWNNKGEYDNALEFYNQALQIHLATLGKNHPSTATSYNNIGSVWYHKGEYDKALEFYNKTLHIFLATLGKNHPSTATSYNNIGFVWHH